MKGFSFFEVPSKHENEILSSLGKFKWNNFKCAAELSKPRDEDRKESKRKIKTLRVFTELRVLNIVGNKFLKFSLKL